jgi:hypothetical protein
MLAAGITTRKLRQEGWNLGIKNRAWVAAKEWFDEHGIEPVDVEHKCRPRTKCTKDNIKAVVERFEVSSEVLDGATSARPRRSRGSLRRRYKETQPRSICRTHPGAAAKGSDGCGAVQRSRLHPVQSLTAEDRIEGAGLP